MNIRGYITGKENLKEIYKKRKEVENVEKKLRISNN